LCCLISDFPRNRRVSPSPFHSYITFDAHASIHQDIEQRAQQVGSASQIPPRSIGVERQFERLHYSSGLWPRRSPTYTAFRIERDSDTVLLSARQNAELEIRSKTQLRSKSMSHMEGLRGILLALRLEPGGGALSADHGDSAWPLVSFPKIYIPSQKLILHA
jgi:hypothetical protein